MFWGFIISEHASPAVIASLRSNLRSISLLWEPDYPPRLAPRLLSHYTISSSTLQPLTSPCFICLHDPYFSQLIVSSIWVTVDSPISTRLTHCGQLNKFLLNKGWMDGWCGWRWVDCKLFLGEWNTGSESRIGSEKSYSCAIWVNISPWLSSYRAVGDDMKFRNREPGATRLYDGAGWCKMGKDKRNPVLWLWRKTCSSCLPHLHQPAPSLAIWTGPNSCSSFMAHHRLASIMH